MSKQEKNAQEITQRLISVRNEIAALPDAGPEEFRQAVTRTLQELVNIVAITTVQHKTDQAAIAKAVEVIGESLKKIMTAFGQKDYAGHSKSRH